MSVKLGAIGVQKVTAKLLEQGFLVSMPVYDDGYDLVTDWKGELRRVQVKCTSGNEDYRRSKLKFFAIKGPGFGHMRKQTYSKADCDTFIFYHTGLDAMFILPRDKTPKTQSIYIEPNSKWRDNWNVLKGGVHK
jgi:hypothetical protein